MVMGALGGEVGAMAGQNLGDRRGAVLGMDLGRRCSFDFGGREFMMWIEPGFGYPVASQLETL